MDRDLKRKEILRGRGIYRTVLTNGLSIRGLSIKATTVAILHSEQTEENIRYFIGILVHREIGKAVRRNRIKRWIRESYRIHKDILGSEAAKKEGPVGIIFSCSKNATVTKNITFSLIENDMKHILSQIKKLKTSKIPCCII